MRIETQSNAAGRRPVRVVIALALFWTLSMPVHAAGPFHVGGNQHVAANQTSVSIELPGSGAPSAHYLLAITPDWNTVFWYAKKTSRTFTIQFATPAPSDGSGMIDWSVFQ